MAERARLTPGRPWVSAVSRGQLTGKMPRPQRIFELKSDIGEGEESRLESPTRRGATGRSTLNRTRAAPVIPHGHCPCSFSFPTFLRASIPWFEHQARRLIHDQARAVLVTGLEIRARLSVLLELRVQGATRPVFRRRSRCSSSVS